jgi:hypothetical protein
LLFEYEIDALYLLLFAKLFAIARKHLAAGRAVLSRGIRTAFFNGTRGSVATVAFQK